jgi:hypothetical protein
MRKVEQKEYFGGNIFLSDQNNGHHLWLTATMLELAQQINSANIKVIAWLTFTRQVDVHT